MPPSPRQEAIQATMQANPNLGIPFGVQANQISTAVGQATGGGFPQVLKTPTGPVVMFSRPNQQGGSSLSGFGGGSQIEALANEFGLRQPTPIPGFNNPFLGGQFGPNFGFGGGGGFSIGPGSVGSIGQQLRGDQFAGTQGQNILSGLFNLGQQAQQDPNLPGAADEPMANFSAATPFGSLGGGGFAGGVSPPAGGGGSNLMGTSPFGMPAAPAFGGGGGVGTGSLIDALRGGGFGTPSPAPSNQFGMAGLSRFIHPSIQRGVELPAPGDPRTDPAGNILHPTALNPAHSAGPGSGLAQTGIGGGAGLPTLAQIGNTRVGLNPFTTPGFRGSNRFTVGSGVGEMEANRLRNADRSLAQTGQPSSSLRDPFAQRVQSFRDQQRARPQGAGLTGPQLALQRAQEEAAARDRATVGTTPNEALTDSQKAALAESRQQFATDMDEVGRIFEAERQRLLSGGGGELSSGLGNVSLNDPNANRQFAGGLLRGPEDAQFLLEAGIIDQALFDRLLPAATRNAEVSGPGTQDVPAGSTLAGGFTSFDDLTRATRGRGVLEPGAALS